MIYDPATKILTMTQTDLEHCGFSWDDFEGELFMSGLMNEEEAAKAKGAFTIVVAMHKGLYNAGKASQHMDFSEEAHEIIVAYQKKMGHKTRDDAADAFILEKGSE